MVIDVQTSETHYLSVFSYLLSNDLIYVNHFLNVLFVVNVVDINVEFRWLTSLLTVAKNTRCFLVSPNWWFPVRDRWRILGKFAGFGLQNWWFRNIFWVKCLVTLTKRYQPPCQPNSMSTTLTKNKTEKIIAIWYNVEKSNTSHVRHHWCLIQENQLKIVLESAATIFERKGKFVQNSFWSRYKR